MEDYGIAFSPSRCHALKAWALDCWDFDPDCIAEYLSIATGKTWGALGVSGYTQGDYITAVFCRDCYTVEIVRAYGELLLGCGAEFTLTDPDGDECGGYYVADSQVKKFDENEYKRILCEWEGLNPAEVEIELTA